LKAARAVVKIGSIVKTNQQKQGRLAQNREMLRTNMTNTLVENAIVNVKWQPSLFDSIVILV